jgi:cytochrome oxidase Cu insertion factor (SCO1/SenC/PrrC family)
VRHAREGAALGALAVILAITASWWALALWPVTDQSPQWIVLTRDVCFGTAATGLPDAGGWLALVGPPLCMLLVLVAAWGEALRAGLRLLADRVSGQLVLGGTAALLVAGVMGVGLRVSTAGAESFATSTTEALVGDLLRLNDVPKPLSLISQDGQRVSLEQFAGRPVIVTFAFAHCTTVCPLIVNDALSARDALPGVNPVVLIVTLDPWRDTPARLPHIARQWGLSGDAYVLSGPVDEVERVLTAWRIPRIRNERTGDLSHPSLAYIVGPGGRINYAIQGSADIIRAAVEAL